MSELIQARVTLPCTVYSPASPDTRIEGTTEEISRDALLVRLCPGAAADSLRPGLTLVADIELPAAEGRAPRHLECSGVVRRVQRFTGAVQAALDITSMAFAAADSAGGQPQSQ